MVDDQINVAYCGLDRRLNFLYYILNESESSLLRQFRSSVRGDLILKVRKDLEEFGMDLKFEEITVIS